MAKRRRRGLQIKEVFLLIAPAVALVVGAFWLAFQFVEPAPPDIVRISSGSEGGGYHTFAKQYAAKLAQSGITLDVATSAGSMDNLARLTGEDHEADVALMQGGIATYAREAGSEISELMSLGRVFLEPLWVFYRADEDLTRLGQLRAKRLAIGAPGSGTRILVETLLKANRISAENADLRPIGGTAAVEALREGEVDAIFLALAPEAPLVGELLRTLGLKLLSLERAEAYTRLFPYLEKVVLPAGVVDLVDNIPPQDISLVAAKAALVARVDTHPAIVGLLVDAARDVHGGGGMFQRVEDFPQPHDSEYEMSEDASRLYKDGPPFLQRYLPFWLATFIERMIVMIVPIATILIPLVKIVPWLYEWRIKRRIYYWFRELRDLERDLAEAGSGSSPAEFVAEIDRIDEAVSVIPVPLHFSDRLYELRAAVDLVRQRISARRQVATATPTV